LDGARDLRYSDSQNQVAVANGIFSIMLGDTAAGDNAIALDFNTPYYLGITVGTDAEMGPSRKPIGASGYAFNSDLLDGLNSAASGANAHILATDSGGGITTIGVNSGVGLIQELEVSPLPELQFLLMTHLILRLILGPAQVPELFL